MDWNCSVFDLGPVIETRRHCTGLCRPANGFAEFALRKMIASTRPAGRPRFEPAQSAQSCEAEPEGSNGLTCSGVGKMMLVEIGTGRICIRIWLLRQPRRYVALIGGA